MGFKLIHEDEPLPARNLIVVLFGEPGVGKTSLSFTSDDPLMMDYDKGVQRAARRKKSVELNSWDDSMEFMDSNTVQELKIKTLINDTAGTMMDDYLTHHILKLDEKLGNGLGGIGLRGYGVLKDSTDKYFSKSQKFGVDLIFVCHTSEEKDGDVIKLKPKITGGAYNILIQKADLIGYMEMRNGKITIDFNPTTRHVGKNCAELPLMNVPHYNDPAYPTFMADIINKTKAHIAKMNEAQLKALQLVTEYKTRIEAVTNLEELEGMQEEIKALTPMYFAQVNKSYETKFMEFWQPIFMNPEKLKTGEDFDALYALIKDLPNGIQLELRAPFKKLLEANGLVYQKDKDPKKIGKYVPAAEAKKEDGKNVSQGTTPQGANTVTQSNPPAPQPGPPAKIIHAEDWFIERVGKKVMAKSEKAFTGPMLITDKAHAGHMAHISQKTGGYEFSDIPEEKTKEEIPVAESKETAPAQA